jgi:hypothetical protein
VLFAFDEVAIASSSTVAIELSLVNDDVLLRSLDISESSFSTSPPSVTSGLRPK